MALKRTILDADQGVCPEGHPCWIVRSPDGSVARSCATPHADLEGDWYYGQPLIAEGVIDVDVDMAEAGGAHPSLIAWARETIAERQVED